MRGLNVCGLHTIQFMSSHPATVHLSERLRIERYRDSRFWAVYLDGELLTVTVYKKGAHSVCLALLSKDPSLAARASSI